jgi:predicted  nucleic acid-binding Zn-ribbon protein
MTTVTNELIYEVLKSMQVRLGRIEDGQRDLRDELVGVRGHVHAMSGEMNNLFSRVSTIETRLDRIERRLEMVGQPAE